MKKVLYAILFLSLFSFLIAEEKICDVSEVMVCMEENVEYCECVPKTLKGVNYPLVIQCRQLKKTICEGKDNDFKCICSNS